jgi:Glutamate synthase domain 3
MNIAANQIDYQTLNEMVRTSLETDITISHCLGQRYIATGLSGKNIEIYGTPGNAMGSYLCDGVIHLYGNAQEATGDTMNGGTIYVHGSAGDGTGYAMRGGRIYIQNDAGYRTGIHMKAYEDKFPVVIIGGCAGSFLGEYQAGGVIVVLGMNTEHSHIVGYFCGTGMHGGKIYLRCDEKSLPNNLPKQVSVSVATSKDMEEIDAYLTEYCTAFSENKKDILAHSFYVLTPDTKNPYKQLYTYV